MYNAKYTDDPDYRHLQTTGLYSVRNCSVTTLTDDKIKFFILQIGVNWVSLFTTEPK